MEWVYGNLNMSVHRTILLDLSFVCSFIKLRCRYSIAMDTFFMTKSRISREYFNEVQEFMTFASKQI
jgi:uncharacterized membrane protein